MPDSSRAVHITRVAAIAIAGACAFRWTGPVDAWQQTPPGSCRISGRAASGSFPLPGVSIVASMGDAVKAATSTDPDGTYHLALPSPSAGSGQAPSTSAGQAYTLTAELTGFTRGSQALTLSTSPCDQSIDFQLTLAPRVQPAAAARTNPATVAAPGAAAP